MKKEKDKDLEITQKKIEEQEKELLRLQYPLLHSSIQQQPQQSIVQVVSVPTVDEQGNQSFSAEPPPQYLQAISQQQAYQQNIIPNQNQISTISQVPINHTIPSQTMLNSEAMNAKLNPFSDAQSVSLPYTAQVPKSLLSKDVKVERNIFTSINDNHTTILYDPLIKKGIVRFEVYSIRSLDKIGIADDSVRYERKEDPEARGFDKIVRYDCPGWIQHSGDFIEGNAKFRTEDSVALELNMDSRPRTLTFFVNDEEQPNYVTNIPAAVRVWAFMMFKDESFKVLKFESLPAPTAQHAAGSRFWEFGKYWKKDK